MLKIYHSQYNGIAANDVTVSFKHFGIVKHIIFTANAFGNITVRLNNLAATDFMLDLIPNTRIVHQLLFSIQPGSTITFLNPSNVSFQYEFFYE